MILALLLAAQPQAVAVLEFRDQVPVEQRIDAAYLSDRVRSAVKQDLPAAKVITRENMLVLLQASGKDLADCEGECEVDTGRRIGADLVVSGDLLRFGTQYKLNMKLHATGSGELISGAVASGATADELDKDLKPAVDRLLGPFLEALREPAQARSPHYRNVLLSLWATLGYSSMSTSTGVPASSGSAAGLVYGFGGQIFFHVVGPLFLGALTDYSFFPSVTGGRTDGLLAGGGVRIDLGEAAILGGAGYSSLSNNGGSGYGLLGAIEYGILRLQLAWRHGSSSLTSGATVLDQTESVIAAQAGVSITF
jgi:hypothetical protein